MTQFDAIVIGGAVSGATFALRMARAGWKIAVVEKSTFPRRKVCGEFLSATNQPLFEDLGIRDRLTALAGPPVTEVAIYHRDDIIQARMPAIANAPSLTGFALGRDQLDDLLLKEAHQHGAAIFQPAKVTDITRHGSEIRIETAEGETLSAPVAVAAHGSWGASNLSTFPRQRPAKPSDLFGFKAHFRNGRLPDGWMPLFVFRGGYGGLVETDCQRVSFSCCIRRDELARLREAHGGREPSPGHCVIRHLIETIRGMRQAIGGAELDGSVLSTGPIRPGIRATFADDVFRVGNAAGEAHPIIAEGITLAMQSSWLLSEAWIKAGREGDPNAVSKAYRLAWRDAFETRIRASAFFAAVAMNPRLTGILSGCFRTWPKLLGLGAELSGKSRMVVR